MAATSELKTFLRGCKVRVGEIETALAVEYDKMATSEAMKAIIGVMGNASPINIRASKAEKADHMALWLQSRGKSEAAELLQAFRRMIVDQEYAAQTFAMLPVEAIDEITALGVSTKKALPTAKKTASKATSKAAPRKRAR